MIGTSVPRRDGRAKVLGTTCYACDKTLPGQLRGVTVRSKVPRAVLKGIRFADGLPWDEFTIVTAADIPGQNRVAAMVLDQPFLVGLGEEIAHPGQAVVLLAHPDPQLAEKGRQAVTLEVEELPAVLDIQSSIDRVQVIHGTDNILKEFRVDRGDPDAMWDRAAWIIEGEYRTGAQEHVYLETNGILASTHGTGDARELEVSGSIQCPYYVHSALKLLFGLPDQRVRVTAFELGGGFGGKEDYPSVIAGHAALLAWKSGRPVKLIYDREEDMACTTKRHPSRTRIKAAFDADGKFLAVETDIVYDGGAYVTVSPVVAQRGTLASGGVYNIPNARVHGRAMATNSPPPGAFRGFGGPQSEFAIERHMDACARRMGLDPVELRRRNFLKIGDSLVFGQVIKENLDLGGIMDRVLGEIGYREKLAAFQAHNATDDPVKWGVGFAVCMHGCGFTGGGEAYLASVVGVAGLPDGRVSILASNTEMGQGQQTAFSQIAAEALEVPMDFIEIAPVDTRYVPNSGPTVASRSTMIVGKLLEEACYSLKQALCQDHLLDQHHTPGQFQEAVRTAYARHGSVKAYAQYRKQPHIVWDDPTCHGDAYPTCAWACNAAVVSVDTTTWEVKLEDFVAGQEVGRVVNPVLATGQIEGGAAQAIAWSLWEEVVMRQGRMANNQLTNYAVPTMADLPRLRVIFFEEPHPAGPGGAKGIGELPNVTPAPAVISALQNALGSDLRLDEVPMTPERLLGRIEERQAAAGPEPALHPVLTGSAP
ncbi:MAG: xanthine dehydrogenase family protein molybdopterin-binding subunit [Holophaga sp.]|nr:xanthine dehydrogenase family protein molybdopterin-binding subunit [Holophaga sp.]